MLLVNFTKFSVDSLIVFLNFTVSKTVVSLFKIKFKGENDADQEIVYAKITGKILDNTDGTEDGILEFSFIKVLQSL